MPCGIVSRRNLRGIGMAAFTALLLAGCYSPAPISYDRIQDSAMYVEEGRLQSIVSDGLARAGVIERLGTPAATACDALGFLRCIDSKSWDVAMLPVPPVPVPLRGRARDCQLIAITFGQDGLANAANGRIQAFNIGYSASGDTEGPEQVLKRMLSGRGELEEKHCLAEQGDSFAQYSLAWIYTAGGSYPNDQNVAQNYVEAYKWFSIVAATSPATEMRTEATKNLEFVSTKMTPAQIAEAQRLASEWTGAFEKRQQAP